MEILQTTTLHSIGSISVYVCRVYDESPDLSYPAMPDTLYFVLFEYLPLYAGSTLESIAELSVSLSPPYWHDLEFYAVDSDGKRELEFWEKREVFRAIDDLTFTF